MFFRFIYFFRERTGIELHPRFVMYMFVFLLSFFLLLSAVFFSSWYQHSVQPKVPETIEERQAQDAAMRIPATRRAPVSDREDE